jgi:hypothetical protein
MRHLNIAALPLVVAPHPLYDLAPAQLQEVARRAFPLIVAQLTGASAPESLLRVDYQRPAHRTPAPGGDA